METQIYTNDKKNTAQNILYLLLSFPLGLFYFIFLSVGFLTGIGTIIVWIGIPILFITFAGIAGIAAMERSLATHMLHIALPSVPRRYAQTWKERFGMRFRDPLTWKSMLYILIKFPLSIISFTIALSLVIISVSLLLGPLEYVIATQILQGLGIHLTTNHEPLLVRMYSIQVTGQFEIVEFAKSFILTLIGIVFWFFSRSLLNGLAWLNGKLVQGLLTSPSHLATPKDGRYDAANTENRLYRSEPYPNL